MAERRYREAEMSAPLAAWLERVGFVVRTEVHWFSRPVDIVAVRGDEFWAIEMKTTLSRHVVHQAAMIQGYCDRCYCAVPTKPRSIDAARNVGVGVLRVIDGAVFTLLEPSGTPPYNPRWHKAWRDRVVLNDPGGIAGMPNVAGDGPAQDVFDRIREFRSNNPKATWKQVFEAVPNHYAHARSMQGAMSKVSDGRSRRERRLAEAGRSWSRDHGAE